MEDLSKDLMQKLDQELIATSDVLEIIESTCEGNSQDNVYNPTAAVILDEFNQALLDIIDLVREMKLRSEEKVNNFKEMTENLKKEASEIKQLISQLGKKLEPFGYKSLITDSVPVTSDSSLEKFPIDEAVVEIEEIEKNKENDDKLVTPHKPDFQLHVTDFSKTPVTPVVSSNIEQTTQLINMFKLESNLEQPPITKNETIEKLSVASKPKEFSTPLRPTESKTLFFSENDNTPKTPEITCKFNFRM